MYDFLSKYKIDQDLKKHYLQCTEIENEDKQDLIEAVAIMADVAAFINESKRRKDIGKKILCTYLHVMKINLFKYD